MLNIPFLQGCDYSCILALFSVSFVLIFSTLVGLFLWYCWGQISVKNCRYITRLNCFSHRNRQKSLGEFKVLFKKLKNKPENQQKIYSKTPIIQSLEVENDVDQKNESNNDPSLNDVENYAPQFSSPLVYSHQVIPDFPQRNASCFVPHHMVATQAGHDSSDQSLYASEFSSFLFSSPEQRSWEEVTPNNSSYIGSGSSSSWVQITDEPH